MNKTAIKNFAIWARVNLMESAKQRAYEYEITENGTNNSNADIIGGRPLSKDEKDQRRQLIEQINSKGFNQVMEEAAYTWFNRFIALRYMEVNGYLPTRIRVFTNEEGAFKPEILKEAMTVELDGLDRDKILELLDKQDNEALYKMLLIAQCNSLSDGLPYMFEKIANWTELLFPANLLKADSVIGQMVTVIPEEDWTDAVQIIGWLYQYYNSELKDETFALLKKNVKITKERIPAATQLFTPDWIVRYMVENSLGRIYIQRKLVNSGEWLVADEATKVSMEKKEAEEMGWKYYLPEAEQEPEVRKQLMQISNTYTGMKVEDIKVIDPCMGSGHILVYAFDVLMQIYTASGWSERDAAKSIIENNIYGLDIDDRAGQLAYFAVMMKARKYNRRILNGSNRPNVMAIQDSAFMTDDLIEYVSAGNKDIKASLSAIRAVFKDAKEYGSILEVKPVDTAAIYQRIEEIEASTPEDIFAMINKDLAVNHLEGLIKQADILAKKYEVVITNPPYMGINSMGGNFYDYIVDKHEAYKHDLYCVFINRCRKYLRKSGIQAMITQQSFMFNSRYEKARADIISNSNCVSLLHLGARAFEEIGGEVVQTCSYIFTTGTISNYQGIFVDLQSGMTQEEKHHQYLEIQKDDVHRENLYVNSLSEFVKIDGYNFSYWLSKKVIDILTNSKKISDYAETRHGLVTGNGELFMRLWPEIRFDTFDHSVCPDDLQYSHNKWFPYNKGGTMRRWYGNREYVVNWLNDGQQIKNYKDDKGKLKSSNYNNGFNCKQNISWSDLSTGKFSARYTPTGALFDTSGPALFLNNEEKTFSLLALMNTNVMQKFLNIYCTGLHYSSGAVGNIPFLAMDDIPEVENIARECVEIARNDWDSFELSWDYKYHPFSRGFKTIKDAYESWASLCEKRFEQLKENEERLNEMAISAYGLQQEMISHVDEEDISVHRADIKRDMRNFISYAVGCMFGRYSLDCDGIAYAGGEWRPEIYKTFQVDADSIIPICDDDYFEDDIVNRFVNFIEVVFDKEKLEENLKFIADALGGKGSAREIIRGYFMSDFYSDHCSTYSTSSSGKRPIYWLFDSGKKNGFKCLIYMHRYQPDTIARIRTDYIHELQSRYRTAIADLEDRVEHAAAGDKVKLNKQLAKIKDQELELRQYEEKIHHLADQMISIDLDDGVKVNYAKFGDVLAKIK